MNAYRNDPRWSAAMNDLLADHERVSPSTALVLRAIATLRMYAIESGRPDVESFLSEAAEVIAPQFGMQVSA